jgi:glycosyltransferase involved in cell wall biosynthesis
MNNTISLIVPIYAAPEKLERILKLLLNIERGSLLQLIVIDDHSPICSNSIFEHNRE